MHTLADKARKPDNKQVSNNFPRQPEKHSSTFQFTDNRPEAVFQGKLKEMVNNSPQVKQLKSMNQVIQLCGRRRKVPYKHDDAAEARAWRMEDRGIGGRNIATLHYTVLATADTMATSEHSLGRHSEALIRDELIRLYGADYRRKLSFQVLYTERDACGSDYHDCRRHVPVWFPGVKVTYSADYPEEAEVSDDSASGSDDEARLLHRRRKAKRRRRRGTAKVKRADRFAAGAASAAAADWEDFDDSADDSG